MRMNKAQRRAKNARDARRLRREVKRVEEMQFSNAMSPGGKIQRDIAELLSGILLYCPEGTERDTAVSCVCLMYHSLILSGLSKKP